MTDWEKQILRAADDREPVAAIAKRFGTNPGRVYRLLEQYRPNRQRSPRTRTSPIPGRVIALSQKGIRAPRIAVLLKITPAYTYKILSDAGIAP